MAIMFYFTILEDDAEKTFLSRTPATVLRDPQPPSLRLLNHAYILESDLSTDPFASRYQLHPCMYMYV